MSLQEQIYLKEQELANRGRIRDLVQAQVVMLETNVNLLQNQVYIAKQVRDEFEESYDNLDRDYTKLDDEITDDKIQLAKEGNLQ